MEGAAFASCETTIGETESRTAVLRRSCEASELSPEREFLALLGSAIAGASLVPRVGPSRGSDNLLASRVTVTLE